MINDAVSIVLFESVKALFDGPNPNVDENGTFILYVPTLYQNF